MRLLKFIVAAGFAVLAMLAGLFVTATVVTVGVAMSLLRRSFGRSPVRQTPSGAPPPRARRVPVHGASRDTIDVVVTEVPGDR